MGQLGLTQRLHGGLRYFGHGTGSGRGSNGIDHAKLVDGQVDRTVVGERVNRKVLGGKKNCKAGVSSVAATAARAVVMDAQVNTARPLTETMKAPMHLRRTLRMYDADEPETTAETYPCFRMWLAIISKPKVGCEQRMDFVTESRQ